MRKKALRISLNCARTAVPPRRAQASPRENCSPVFARTAVEKQRYLSSLPMTNPFIAVPATRQCVRANSPGQITRKEQTTDGFLSVVVFPVRFSGKGGKGAKFRAPERRRAGRADCTNRVKRAHIPPFLHAGSRTGVRSRRWVFAHAEKILENTKSIRVKTKSLRVFAPHPV